MVSSSLMPWNDNFGVMQHRLFPAETSILAGDLEPVESMTLVRH